MLGAACVVAVGLVWVAVAIAGDERAEAANLVLRGVVPICSVGLGARAQTRIASAGSAGLRNVTCAVAPAAKGSVRSAAPQ